MRVLKGLSLGLSIELYQTVQHSLEGSLGGSWVFDEADWSPNLDCLNKLKLEKREGTDEKPLSERCFTRAWNLIAQTENDYGRLPLGSPYVESGGGVCMDWKRKVGIAGSVSVACRASGTYLYFLCHNDYHVTANVTSYRLFRHLQKIGLV